MTAQAKQVLKRCSRCGEDKELRHFRALRTGRPTKQCDECRIMRQRWESTTAHRRQLEEGAPEPAVKRTKRGGIGVEDAGAKAPCTVCGSWVCFDTDGCGRLIALEPTLVKLHPHQPPPPDAAANRTMVQCGLAVEGYA